MIRKLYANSTKLKTQFDLRSYLDVARREIILECNIIGTIIENHYLEIVQLLNFEISSKI